VFKTKIILFVAVFISMTAFSQKKWTLKECVHHALENNISIKKNKLNIAVQKENVVNAKGNFLPTVSASSGGNFGFGSTFDPVSKNRVATSTFGGSFGLRSGVTVFNGFRNLNTRKQAKLGVTSSQLDLEVIEDNISLNVVNSYLNILFAKENLNVAQVQYEISKKQIERAKSQFDAGVKPKGDLLNAKSTAANDAQNVIAQQNILDIALLNLAQLLQISAVNFNVAPLEIDSPSIATLYKDSNLIYEKALLNRPEIEKAKLEIENADLSIAIAKSSYMPTVSASASASTNYGFNFDLPVGTSNKEFFKQINDNLGYGLGFSINVPIFNGFKTDSNVNRSKINKEITEFNLESQKLQLQQTIQKAYLDAKSSAKSYEAAEISLSAQKEAFKNAQERYNYGAMTLFDFDQVRNRLVNAESAMIRAKYDYVFKTKVLKFYYGESILE